MQARRLRGCGRGRHAAGGAGGARPPQLRAALRRRASRSASPARSPSSRRATRTATCTSPRWTRTARRRSTSASRTASRSSTRNGITPADAQGRQPGSASPGRCRGTAPTCASSTRVELADGRVLSVNGPRGGAPRRRWRARKDIFGTWLLAPIAEPQHQRPAADDRAADAGGREGRRRLRPVQGRPDVPLRSGGHPPRVGRAGHAARDRRARAATSCCATSGWTCGASST